MAQPLPPLPLDQRVKSLGTTCLVLGILELLYCAQKLVTQIFSRSMIAGQRSFFPTRPHGPPMGKMVDAAQELAAAIAPWEIARTLPYVAATAMLLVIAVRLRRGELAALAVARQWVVVAFGVIAVSLLIQVVAIVPATLDYQHAIVDSMPATTTRKGAPPFDVKQMMSSMTLTATLFGLVMGTALMSAWPIVLRVWSGRLQRDARAAALAHAPTEPVPVVEQP